MLTPEQLQGIKEIYLKIRGILDHIVSAQQQSPGSSARKIQRNMDPTSVGMQRHPSLRTKFIFDPNDIRRWQQTFPDMKDGFGINFGGSNAMVDDLSTLNLDVKSLSPETLDRMKRTVQHELQHLVSRGSEPGEDVKSIVDYLATDGEVRAHAAQAAYLHRKLHPTEEEFDVQKAIVGADEQEQIKLTNYVKFADPAGSKSIADKTGDPVYINIIMTAGENFLNYAQWFLTHQYKAPQQQAPTAQAPQQ